MEISLTIAQKTFSLRFGVDIIDHALEERKREELRRKISNFGISTATAALSYIAGLSNTKGGDPFSVFVTSMEGGEGEDPAADEENRTWTGFRPGGEAGDPAS